MNDASDDAGDILLYWCNPPQFSVTEKFMGSGMVSVHCPVVSTVIILSGHFMAGFTASLTMIGTEHSALLLAQSLKINNIE